ncbi:MAG: dihydrofolate reductase [Segetibacter sp.]|nr:dihydrofolate reductase [Segetibacter sp.]
MRKLVLFMHVSVDGFVAGPNGEMDWINVNEEMFDVAGQQTNEADTALYGRVTYQMMQSYWPTAGDQPGATKHDIEHSAWYNKVKKVVLSKTMKEAELTNTKVISENSSGEVRKLKQEPGKNILIFGSPTAAHSLMENNLIDDYWLFINPVLLGKGIPLFTALTDRIKLKLVTSKVFAAGVVCLHYTMETNK